MKIDHLMLIFALYVFGLKQALAMEKQDDAFIDRFLSMALCIYSPINQTLLDVYEPAENCDLIDLFPAFNDIPVSELLHFDAVIKLNQEEFDKKRVEKNELIRKNSIPINKKIKKIRPRITLKREVASLLQ
jgi:hypothetical protein